MYFGTSHIAGYRSAGFLAYLSTNTEAPPGNASIPFDVEVYDYGDNYNPSSGIYTVPLDGLYVIHARLRGLYKDAGRESKTMAIHW